MFRISRSSGLSLVRLVIFLRLSAFISCALRAMFTASSLLPAIGAEDGIDRTHSFSNLAGFLIILNFIYDFYFVIYPAIRGTKTEQKERNVAN